MQPRQLRDVEDRLVRTDRARERRLLDGPVGVRHPQCLARELRRMQHDQARAVGGELVLRLEIGDHDQAGRARFDADDAAEARAEALRAHVERQRRRPSRARGRRRARRCPSCDRAPPRGLSAAPAGRRTRCRRTRRRAARSDHGPLRHGRDSANQVISEGWHVRGSSSRRRPRTAPRSRTRRRRSRGTP